MNLGEMRAYVRAHTDLDETDIPDVLVDSWLREGYRRVQEYAHQWPHLLDEETYVVADGEVDASEWRVIQEVRIDRWTLKEIPHRVARGRWPDTGASNGTPSHYSLFNDTLYIWPSPASQTVYVRGVRDPQSWPLGGEAQFETVEEVVSTEVSWPPIESFVLNLDDLESEWPVAENVTASETEPEDPDEGDLWLTELETDSWNTQSYTVAFAAPTGAPSTNNVVIDATTYNTGDGTGGVLYFWDGAEWTTPSVERAAGAPDEEVEADFYLNITNTASPTLFVRTTTSEQVLYLWDGSEWVDTEAIFDEGEPSLEVGDDGDYYVDTDDDTVYGPKSTPSLESLVSSENPYLVTETISGLKLYVLEDEELVELTLLVGSPLPTSSTGSDGTYYYAEIAGQLFGPRDTEVEMGETLVPVYVPTPSSETPTLLPPRMHDFVPRWAIIQAYLREADQNMVAAMRAEWFDEIERYRQREVYTSGSEAFTMNDGGGSLRTPNRLRYDWE